MEAATAPDQLQVAVDVHDVPVTLGADNAIQLIPHREQIRANGPSVRSDLGLGYWKLGAPTPALPPLPSEGSTSPFAGIYQYDEYDRQFLRDRAAQFGDQAARRLSGELSEDEFKPLRLMNGLYLQLHGYMLRVAIPYGVLSATQMRQLAYVARHYDRGYGHFTTRQNIQFNWPRLEDTPAILAALAEADMHAIQTSGNCVRNVTTDHFAGAAADEIVDPRLYAEILRQWSTDHPEFTYLPRKFKIAITGSPNDRAAVRAHDIGILAKRDKDGNPAFEIYAGGGLGRTPCIAVKVREWLPVRDLLRYVECILRVYNALGRRDNMYKARIKILIRDMKPENFIQMIEDEFATMPADYMVLEDATVATLAARFLPPPFAELPRKSETMDEKLQSDRAFRAWTKSNTHPHHVPGYISAVISLKPTGGIPGDASAEEMELVAEPRGSILLRRSPRLARTKPDPAAYPQGRSLHPLVRPRGRWPRHRQYRPDHGYHRLPGHGLLRARHRPLHPRRPAHRRTLRRPGTPTRNRRARPQHLRLHQCLRASPCRPYRPARRR